MCFNISFFYYLSDRNKINSSSSSSSVYLKARKVIFRHEERSLRSLWPVKCLRLDIPWNYRAGRESERKLRLADDATCLKLFRELLNLLEICHFGTQSGLSLLNPYFPGVAVPDQQFLPLALQWSLTEHL